VDESSPYNIIGITNIGFTKLYFLGNIGDFMIYTENIKDTKVVNKIFHEEF